MFGAAPRIVHRSVATALMVGVLAGLVGSGVKVVGEMIYPPRTLGQVPPPILLAERIEGHTLQPHDANMTMQAIHYTFGAATGAIYSAVAEFAPMVTSGYGVGLGVVLLALTHESTVPALGLDVPASKQPLREQTSELLTHSMFGVGTELVRRLLRRKATQA